MLDLDKKISRQILNKVSRTFALNIPLLDANKVSEVENQYLLMRFADTIEDSNHPADRKKFLLESFVDHLDEGKYAGLEDIASCVGEQTIDSHDLVLIKNFRSVLNVFSSFDPQIRNMSLRWLSEMASGMIKYSENKVDDFNGLNDYCYYVAGTVGRYLTELVFLKDDVWLDRDKAVSFGKYLQKVNIIRDFYKDVKESRCFWPSELFVDNNPNLALLSPDSARNMEMLDLMVCSAVDEMNDTFKYITSIPDNMPGYRKFCVMPAVIATETLKKIEGNAQVFSEQKVKIGKLNLYSIILRTRFDLYENEFLKKYCCDSWEDLFFKGKALCGD